MVSVLLLTSCSLFAGEPSQDKAEDLVKNGKIDKAIEMYEELLNEDEEDYNLWKGLVEAYMEDEEWEDAVDYYIIILYSIKIKSIFYWIHLT